MKYQIDQSGKIEDTAKNTIIAYSNGEQYAICIPKKVKRQVQEIFRKNGMTRLYIYVLFALGVYFSVKKFDKKQDLTIDIEYQGREKIIKQLIVKLLEANSKPSHYIQFARIGNHPRVHYAAYNVLVGKKRPNYTVSLKEIVRELKKTDGRLRECFSTLVGVQPRSYGYKLARRHKKVKQNKS